MSMSTSYQHKTSEEDVLTVHSISEGLTLHGSAGTDRKIDSKAKELISKVKKVYKKWFWNKHKGQRDSHYQSELIELCFSLARRCQNSENETTSSHKFFEVNWTVQKLKREYSLVLPPPYFEEMNADKHIDLTSFTSQLPEDMMVIYHKADPKKLINMMLPHGAVCDEARKVGAMFWLWLCITDDILEDMDDEEFKGGINDMHKSLAEETTGFNRDSSISWVTHLFVDSIKNAKITGLDGAQQQLWQSALIVCVQEIAHAFELERPLAGSGRAVNLEDWMKLRVVTISARPFMVLAKASLKLPCGLSPLGNPFSPLYEKYIGEDSGTESDLTSIETTMQCILGLQNDILGWEKDNKDGMYLNCVQVLLAKWNATIDFGCHTALTTAIDTHNQLVLSLVDRASRIIGIEDPECCRPSSAGSFSLSGPTNVPSLAGSSSASRTGSRAANTRSATPGTSTSDLCSYAPLGDSITSSSSTISSASTAALPIGETESLFDATEAYCENEHTNEQDCMASFTLFGRSIKVPWSPRSRTPTFVKSLENIEQQKQVEQYLRVLQSMAYGMANWMVNSKRYAVKE